MSQFSSSSANNLEESQKQCIYERREEECLTGEDYELGRKKYNEGVSADQIRENIRRSEWNSNELGLLAAIGSKSVQETRLESCPLSIPRQPPLPTQYADGQYTSNDALVLSQRGPLPFSNDLTVNSGTLQGQARDSASLLRSQLLLGSLIRHWSSGGIYDMMRSSSIALGYTPRTRNIITPQLAQPSSSPIEENVSRMGIDLLRQYYEQSFLIVQLLDRGLESGPFSLRITSGRNDQGVLLLGQSSMFNAVDLHDRYEDMRVDVENMSYEELLDLEDRIGDVSTGVSDEMIDEHLKQRKYFILLDEKALKESCSICQEDYVEEDGLGSLECGHEFHFSCLKQWLRCKNVCPVCKSTGLSVGPKV